MPAVNVYLTFNGNCRQAFEFYKSVFGGEFSWIGTFADVPPSDDYNMPESEKDRIMHVSLPISKETVLMGSDSSSFSGDAEFGNNISVYIDTGSRQEAEHFFNALGTGGVTIMPLADTFWGAYFGMVTDKFGINWMISYDLEQQG